MTVREAIEAFNGRRASAGAGLIERTIEAGGALLMDEEETARQVQVVAVGLDVDMADLRDVFLEMVRENGSVHVGLQQLTGAAPEVVPAIVMALLASAAVDGYLVGAIQHSAPRESVPCPHCGSEATEENPATEFGGAMICADCGCRWRP